MKYLLLLSLLLSFFAGHSQSALPLYTGVYYKLKEPAPGYAALADTSAVGTGATPLPQNTKMLIVGYPAAGWAWGVKAGTRYFVRIKSRAVFEKPLPGTDPAHVGPPVATAASNSSAGAPATNQSPGGYSPSSYHDVQVGPRGGHYYINSNGNKTYIRRK